MLLDEIVMNHSLGESVEFHTHDSSLKTIEFFKENPDSFLLFFNDSPKDYIQAKSMLKQINELNELRDKPVCSMAIVNNSDPTVEKSLRELGVKNIFTHDYHAADIIDKMEKYVTNRKESTKSKQVKDKISQKEADDIINLVVDKNDYRQDDFSKVISSSLPEEEINLESGQLNIGFNSGQDGPTQCSLENFEENSLELSVYGKTDYKQDDKIELNIAFKYNRCKVELLIDGVIEVVEQTGDDACVVTIKLTNNEAVSLENFMNLYQQRQKSINDFMELAKGY